MSRPTLNQIRNLGNFTTLENWFLSFSKLPDGVTFSSDDLNLRTESFDRPSRSNAINSIQIRGLPPVKQHGITTPSGSTTINLFSTVDMVVEKAIKQLMATAGVNGASESAPGRYKKDSELRMQVTLRDVTNKDIYRYEFIGVLIESFDAGGSLGAGSELSKPSITFQWDDYTETSL